MSPSSPIGDLHPQLMPPRAVHELASGVDSLYLSGRAVLPDSFLVDLERIKRRAMDSGEAEPVNLGGVEFGLTPYGWGRYPYRLSHEHGLIGFTSSEHLPAVRVQPRAELLHGLGPEGTVDAFSGLVSVVAEVEWLVSRASYVHGRGVWRENAAG